MNLAGRILVVGIGLTLPAAMVVAQSSKPSASFRPLQPLVNSLLFYPVPASQNWFQPAEENLVQDVWLEAADGNRIHAWWIPCPGATGAVLFCHGNAGNLSHRAVPAFQLMRALNQSVLIFDYPGYGKSSGKPTEEGCYAASNAAYDWLIETKEIPANEIILFGKSLGGGVATDLASRRTHRALVLKTFSSLPDMAKKSMWTSASAPLVKNQFDNLAKIRRCPSPIFIAHGDRDRLIPLAQGYKLYETALGVGERPWATFQVKKEFFLLKGSGHNDPLPAKFFAALGKFLAEEAPSQVKR